MTPASEFSCWLERLMNLRGTAGEVSLKQCGGPGSSSEFPYEGERLRCEHLLLGDMPARQYESN